MLTRRPLRRAAALAAVAVFALAGCGSDGGGKSANSDQQGYVEGKGIKQVAQGDRKAAPEVSGKTLDGQPVSLADFKGKVVVLNVWGSWCAPCRGEAPFLAQVA